MWFRERQTASNRRAQSWDILSDCASGLLTAGARVGLGTALAAEPAKKEFDIVLTVL